MPDGYDWLTVEEIVGTGRLISYPWQSKIQQEGIDVRKI
jgi:hypothetical protein